MTHTTHPSKVTRVPTLLSFGPNKVPGTNWREMIPGRGDAGWTVYQFADAREAARFVEANRASAMPCWQRFEIINGELIQVR